MTDDVHAIPTKLGWSNPDCGPEQLRLYALDVGPDPRWAHPHARVAETALIAAGHREGDRAIVVPVGGVPVDVLDQLCAVATAAVAAELGRWKPDPGSA
jgi:hypothetical protein